MSGASSDGLELLRTLAASVGTVVGSKRHEVKFTFEGVHLSAGLLGGRGDQARVEQRVTLHRERLRGSPSGIANLLLAVNALNATTRGLRVVVLEERIAFRRPLLLSSEGAPLTRAEFRRAAKDLVEEWAAVLPCLRKVEDGAPWAGAVPSGWEAGPPSAEAPSPVLEGLAAELRPVLSVRPVRGGRLAVWANEDVPEDERMVLTQGAALHATLLVRRFRAPREEVDALAGGGRSERLEGLLEDLARRNRTRPYALVWLPGVGIVARTTLTVADRRPPRALLVRFLNLLGVSLDVETFPGIGP